MGCGGDSHAYSEQFRSDHGTHGPLCGRLRMRATDCGEDLPMFDVRRREFITLLGGAAVAWPLAANAQQSGRLRTIGFLGQSTRSAASEWVAAFVQRLRELGWIEGRNVAIEYRWAEGREERFAEIAAEF